MSKFLDYALIEVASGDGGNGMIAWRREKYEPMGGPAGGNGGRGGHIFIESSADINTLIDFRYRSKFRAGEGQRGRTSKKDGPAATDLTIKVPVGTLIKDQETGQIIGDLVTAGQKILVAEGGRGGRGNATFASPTQRAPHFCEPGEPGIKRQLALELKLLADVGLVGLPNAGKSTLLSVLTHAKPKIASYPFSTLSPMLGVVGRAGADSYVIADIPGLIAGAHQGIGLGHDFLRHIERTRLLIHIVDMTSENLLSDIQMINDELKLFNETLKEKEQIIALNKSDLLNKPEVEALKTQVEKAYKTNHVCVISAASKSGLKELCHIIEERLTKLKSKEQKIGVEPIAIDTRAHDRQDEGFSITRQKNKFLVTGSRIERLLSVTDTKSPESIHHFNQILRAIGVMDELMRQQIKPGNEIKIAELTFTFGENLF